jgi:hypothetical protein
MRVCHWYLLSGVQYKAMPLPNQSALCSKRTAWNTSTGEAGLQYHSYHSITLFLLLCQ